MATVLPSHHLPTGPSLVQVTQSGKERIRVDRCHQQEEELTWQGGAQRGCRAWRRWPPSGSAATPSSTGRCCSGLRPSSTHLMPRPYLSKIVLSTLTHFTFLGPYFHTSTMNWMLEFVMALTDKFSNDTQFCTDSMCHNDCDIAKELICSGLFEQESWARPVRSKVVSPLALSAQERPSLAPARPETPGPSYSWSVGIWHVKLTLE